MGYIKHNAIVVTGWNEKQMDKVHKKSIELGNLTSNIVNGAVNGFISFFVAADGSKEGWEESNKGDTAREELIKYINSLKYNDSSNSCHYIEISYSDDYGNAKIVQTNA